MAARFRHKWATFDGGPLTGTRTILDPTKPDNLVVQYTPATPGMRTPHEYRRTDEVRKGVERHSGKHRVYVYVRTGADEPVPPVPIGHGTP